MATVTPPPLERWLGHPVAYLLTAAVLLTIFGWTFFAMQTRVAPSNDPAYYTWRTEVLLTETPETLLDIEGPRYEGGGGMFSRGYRVSAVVLGGMMRRVAAVASLSTAAFLMAGIPVLTALLLGAFAFQHRRDPLVFHVVSLGAGSLFLTPPFLGYLDNLLALCFVAAALLFLRDAPRSWPARIGFGSLLVTAGFAHPTTLVIFVVTLAAMALVRLLCRGFDVPSVVRDDGAPLMTAVVSLVMTYALWKLGIWGRSVSLGDAALLPPYEPSFFFDRLVRWFGAMRPAVNGPLFLLGAAVLVGAGRRAAEDDLSRVSLVWLVPLIGMFGFLADASYPYYRFFNTTLAWVLLVGIGMWVAARFFISLAQRGGIYKLGWLGVVAVVLVIGTNFRSSLETSGGRTVAGGWLPTTQQAKLDLLRGALAEQGDPRPVVFVVDSSDISPRVYSHTKFSANMSRYALPPGWIDEAYVYLGSLEKLLDGEPTSVGATTYDELSRATLQNVEANAPEGSERIVVVAAPFNRTGSNTDLLNGPDPIPSPAGTDVWVVDRRGVSVVSASGRRVPLEPVEPVETDPNGVHILRVVVGLVLLLLPGSLAARWLLRDATFAEWLAAAPALAISILTLVTIAVLSVSRAPLGRGEAWAALTLSIALTGVVAWRSHPPAPDPAP